MSDKPRIAHLAGAINDGNLGNPRGFREFPV